MVIKLGAYYHADEQGFESSVISYGNQTLELRQEFRRKFESGVISYGNQT